MAITDELRRGGTHLSVTDRRAFGEDELVSIADRIDAEHEADVSTACRLAAVLDNDALAKRGYIALPVDAEGVPIRIGDVVYDCNESPSEKFSVAIMELNKWGWSLLDSYGERNEPCQCLHYHKPTVEDVLREFFSRYVTTKETKAEDDAILAEFAAKLRLAGDGE